jgi:hypothetical protein
MRVLKILALTVIVVLLVAGVASAAVRDGLATVADTAEDVLTADTDPSPLPSPADDPTVDPMEDPTVEPADDPTDEPTAEPVDESEPTEYADHGAEVSEMARSGETASWTNPAGKVITNHGMAVRAVAHPDADGAEAAGGAGKGGKDK